MNCPEYQNLNDIEKYIFIGKLVHTVQSDSAFFNAANDLIKYAEDKGVLNGVKILPNYFEDEYK